MSLMDKIKSFFSGGPADAGDHAAHDHAGHDHTGHDHTHDHDAQDVPPMPPADPLGMPVSDPVQPSTDPDHPHS